MVNNLANYGVPNQGYMIAPAYNNLSTNYLNASANPQTAQQQSPQGSLLNAASNAKSAFNLFGNNSSGGLLNNVTNGINNLGANYLGTGFGSGFPTLAGAGVGPIASAGESAALSASADASGLSSIINAGGAGESAIAEGGGLAGVSGAGSLTSASLSSILGAAGIGYFGGGVLANLLGENQTGGSIGGALGAGIGTMIFPGVGSVVGGLIGSVAGGLFGNNTPPDDTQVAGVELANGKINPIYENTQSSTGDKFNANNKANAKTMQQGASNMAQWLIQNGASPLGNIHSDNPNLVIKVGSRDGIQIGTQNESSGPEGNGAPTAPVYSTSLPKGANAQQVATAVANTVKSQYRLTPELEAKLNGMDTTSFFSPNYNSSQLTSGGVQGTNAAGLNNQPNFITPSIAPANNNGRGLLQIPDNSTGQTGIQG